MRSEIIGDENERNSVAIVLSVERRKSDVYFCSSSSCVRIVARWRNFTLADFFLFSRSRVLYRRSSIFVFSICLERFLFRLFQTCIDDDVVQCVDEKACVTEDLSNAEAEGRCTSCS